MAIQMIAKCGLICTECESYLATQANDIPTLTELAEKASQQFGISLTWEDSQCDGCLTVEGRKIGYCSQCKVRQCAVERGVENCAHCPDYGCTVITEFFDIAPAAKTSLDAIHAALN